MKLCPTCNRNYADDTLIFCTDDGSNLTAAYDANATWQIPAARNTDPPATEVIPPQHLPGYQGSGTWPAQRPPAAEPIPPTVQAGGAPPPQYPPPPQYQSAPQYQPAPLAAPKKSNGPWIAVIALLGIVVLGMGSALGYMWWQSGSTSNKPDVNINITTPNANNPRNDNSSANVNSGDPAGNTNSGGGIGSGEGDGNDATWLEGTWSGTGTQYDGGTWTFKYVNANGTHKIDYPSVKCGGRWEPVSIKSNEANFIEKITTKGSTCLSDGRVVVTKTSDGALNCKWYYIGDIVGAEATLRRE